MIGKTLPFNRGKTYFGGSPTNSTDGDGLLGAEYEVTRGPSEADSGCTMVLRAVRNSAGFAVEAKRRVLLNAAGDAILGYTRLPEEEGPFVDELIPSGGVATNDICFVCVEGPCIGLTSLSDYSADIAAGNYLNGQTAVTSGATTAGRVDARAVVAATADATAGQRNVTENDGAGAIARSAALTNSTNNSLLVRVIRKYF